MNQQEMISSLRAEIAKLQQVVDLLEQQPTSAPVQRRGPGQPKKITPAATGFNPVEFTPAKRGMSPEGKARIAAAQRKRWASQKALASPVSARKKAVSAKQAATPRLANKTAKPAGKTSSGRPRKAAANPTKRVAKKVAAPRRSATKKTASGVSPAKATD